MITSMSNETIKELVKLKQKKYRDMHHEYLVEGEHLVEEALKVGVVECLISTKEIKSSIAVIVVSEEVMKKLAFTKTPQSIMAKCHMPKEVSLLSTKRYLVLDDLQDPGNIGTLIRTALAFGVQQVILSPRCVDIYNDKVLRAMQGANFYLTCLYQELSIAIPALCQQGVIVVGSALEGGKNIETVSKEDKMAFVVGNEGSGMSQEIKALCDKIVYIPISTIESLNVAIAGSIMMFHFHD